MSRKVLNEFKRVTQNKRMEIYGVCLQMFTLNLTFNFKALLKDQDLVPMLKKCCS